MVKNELPAYEIISGAAIAFAALLLIIPGFATDLVGFLLIFPLTRKLFFRNIIGKIKKENKSKDYIDGDFEDIEEDNDKKFKILGQYIKDMSSETADVETFLFVKDNISKYQLNIDINSKAIKNKLIEVNVTLKFEDKEPSEKNLTSK